jgi:hypothetical protein
MEKACNLLLPTTGVDLRQIKDTLTMYYLFSRSKKLTAASDACASKDDR